MGGIFAGDNQRETLGGAGLILLNDDGLNGAAITMSQAKRGGQAEKGYRAQDERESK
ncbi:MAG: hypothetical protein BroJett018_51250 [Chloroflexota bacterium]|nr:MAG: hypothetical protein BroJett018_51250 [Chloroflexota bacterium]